MPWYWPFRVGDDIRFQTGSTAGSIYGNIGDDMPEHSFEMELKRYGQNRWRRGWLQNVVPATFYGTIFGLMVGARQARIEGRYLGRHRIVARYTATFAAIGLGSSALHHFLVVSNNYRTTWYQPMIAGTAASGLFTVLTSMGSITQGVMAGSIIGIIYSAWYAFVTWYENRSLRTFLKTQQHDLTPVHKVAPELQPLYRSFLYDYRPLEEATETHRRAVQMARTADDTRLDAYTTLANLTPEVYDWVNFPDWWPLKYPLQDEEEQLVAERLMLEETARRKHMIMDAQGGVLMKHKNRSPLSRER